MTGRSDKELCELLAVGSEDREAAFSELYRRYSARIYRYSRRILSREEEADDILQETFIKFLASVENGKEIENVAAYLLRIARNLSLNLETRRPATTELEELHAVYTPAPMESEETTEMITMALDLLPREMKEALVLQVYSGLSYQEIAETMGVPMTTIRNWIVRGKAKMRETLAQYFETSQDETHTQV
jgi:RNA polymerase sigma-70 factor (ECF subfamily)